MAIEKVGVPDTTHREVNLLGCSIFDPTPETWFGGFFRWMGWVGGFGLAELVLLRPLCFLGGIVINLLSVSVDTVYTGHVYDVLPTSLEGSFK